MTNMHNSRFTFDLPKPDRDALFDLAEAEGISAGECLRRILAARLAQLREEQS